MRFMMIVKGDDRSEAGVMPTEQELLDMAQYNEELIKAGVMLAGEGLQPTSKGAKVRYDGKQRTVIDGPFVETKEILAGYWLIRADSLQEAIAWAKKVPFREGEVEIRQVFELEDFEPSEGLERHREIQKKLGN